MSFSKFASDSNINKCTTRYNVCLLPMTCVCVCVRGCVCVFEYYTENKRCQLYQISSLACFTTV